MSDVLWMQDYEQVGEDFAAGRIDEDQAVSRLRRLGFDVDEALDEIAELKA